MSASVIRPLPDVVAAIVNVIESGGVTQAAALNLITTLRVLPESDGWPGEADVRIDGHIRWRTELIMLEEVLQFQHVHLDRTTAETVSQILIGRLDYKLYMPANTLGIKAPSEAHPRRSALLLSS